jgi:hypothetical protein
MTFNSSVLVTGEKADGNQVFSETSFVFSMQEKNEFSLHHILEKEDILENLVFEISKNPKHLIIHIQRINYCFKRNNSEQLFAALSDLFRILDHKGTPICKRMYASTKSRLGPDRKEQLQQYLENTAELTENKFCVLGIGVIGTVNLVQQIHSSGDQDHDPLLLARDHIEFSQLEEAKRVLEKAIVEISEREALHVELLRLYKATKDISSFHKMYEVLKALNNPMQEEWDKLNIFFNS